MTQKVRQALSARELEEQWKKSEILEAYLNLVAFRGEIVGINALAQTLFEKHPSGLDWEEAAIAAALVRGPNANAVTVAQRACGILKLQSLGCDGIVARTETRALAPWHDAAGRATRAPLRAPGDSIARIEWPRDRAMRTTPRRATAARGDRRACAASSPSFAAARRRRRRRRARQRERRRPRLGRLVRRAFRRGGGRRRSRPPAARLDAEALRLRARLRAAVHHARHTPRRFARATRHRERPVPAAELRPPLQGLGQRAHGARREPQRSGRARRRDARRRCALRAAQRVRPRAAGKRRLLRRVAGARQRRRHAARADQRLSRAGQRRRLSRRQSQWPRRGGYVASPMRARSTSSPTSWPTTRPAPARSGSRTRSPLAASRP